MNGSEPSPPYKKGLTMRFKPFFHLLFVTFFVTFFRLKVSRPAVYANVGFQTSFFGRMAIDICMKSRDMLKSENRRPLMSI